MRNYKCRKHYWNEKIWICDASLGAQQCPGPIQAMKHSWSHRLNGFLFCRQRSTIRTFSSDWCSHFQSEREQTLIRWKIAFIWSRKNANHWFNAQRVQSTNILPFERAPVRETRTRETIVLAFGSLFFAMFSALAFTPRTYSKLCSEKHRVCIKPSFARTGESDENGLNFWHLETRKEEFLWDEQFRNRSKLTI